MHEVHLGHSAEICLSVCPTARLTECFTLPLLKASFNTGDPSVKISRSTYLTLYRRSADRFI